MVAVVREAASTWYCVTVAPLAEVRWVRLPAASYRLDCRTKWFEPVESVLVTVAVRPSSV